MTAFTCREPAESAIPIQRTGNRVATNEDMQKELGLDDAQKAKIKALVEAQNTANQEIFQKMRDGSIDRSEVMALREKNNKALDEEIGKVFTPAQATKLKGMAGAPFKFDEDGGN